MPRLTNPTRRRAAGALLGAICALLLPVWSQAEAATCAGKKATIVGTPGNDVIVGRKASDVIYGGGGDDRISGGPNGNDRICGGPGDDTIGGGDGGDRLYGQLGHDSLTGSAGPDRLHGSHGDDRLFSGRASDKVLEGSYGDDRIFSGRGNDSASGGSGIDHLDGGLGDDRLKGGRGDDDVVVGNHGSDTATGGRGNRDVVRGELGHDRLDGGPGGGDIVSFAGASESVTVDLPNGVAEGDGKDRLSGFESVIDSSFPGEGIGDAAVIRTANIDGTATLSVRGGDGGDEIAVDFDGSGYAISTATGFPAGSVQGCDSSGDLRTVRCPGGVSIVTISAEGGDDLVRVAGNLPHDVQVRIDGGPGADALHGGSGNEVIEAGDDGDADLLAGGPGDDALIGARTDLHVPIGSGASTMIGGEGSDVLVGGDPCDGDLYDGGSGDDNANFFRFTPGVSAKIGGAARRDGDACRPGRVLGSIEAMEGSPGSDRLIGDTGDNSLSGGAGHDTLLGLSGSDRLVGGGGDDRLLGGAGSDSAHQ